jgi:Protein of unknown function (DUF4031)
MIYVDDAKISADVWNVSTGRWVRGIWFHMFSDDLDPRELHAFAQVIGMRRSYFQKGTAGAQVAPWKDHYDVTTNKRTMAIQYGATPVSNEEAVRIWTAKRNSYRESSGQ